MRYLVAIIFVSLSVVAAFSQDRKPSVAKRPYVVKTKQQIADIEKALTAKPGNTNEDIVVQTNEQTRVAVFHDSKRENDMNEVHDGSDDIYYVLSGKATLMLGGTLVDPKEISPGEWRAKEATGGEKIEIKKGDLVFVPRGTRHQRTVTGKGFSMILIKVFSEKQLTK